MREFEAMHEDNFLSSWLREDVVGTGRRKDREQKVREEESRSGKTKVEREEEKTVIVKRRCVDHFSSDVFVDLVPLGSFENSWNDLHGDSSGFSECVLAGSSGVLVVTDGSVFLSSVGVLGEAVMSGSDR